MDAAEGLRPCKGKSLKDFLDERCLFIWNDENKETIWIVYTYACTHDNENVKSKKKKKTGKTTKKNHPTMKSKEIKKKCFLSLFILLVKSKTHPFWLFSSINFPKLFTRLAFDCFCSLTKTSAEKSSIKIAHFSSPFTQEPFDCVKLGGGSFFCVCYLNCTADHLPIIQSEITASAICLRKVADEEIGKKPSQSTVRNPKNN